MDTFIGVGLEEISLCKCCLHKDIMVLKCLRELGGGRGVADHTPPPQLLLKPSVETFLGIREVSTWIQNIVPQTRVQLPPNSVITLNEVSLI